MKSTFKWGTIAFGVSLISTLVYGQARTPYTRPAYITTTGNISTSANVSASTLSVGTTSTSTRAHFLTEATAYTPTDFTTAHAVFGRNAVSGAGSGGVWLSYHTTDNEGIVGSLSPVVSWRPLSFASSEWKFRQNGATLIANITSTGAFNSVAASGNQAFTCTNTGCRLSLGNTGRYLVDDGTNLEFIAPVQATSFDATNTSGNAITGGNASIPFLLTSNTTDAITTGGTAAVQVKSGQTLTAGDLIFQVLRADNQNFFSVATDGTTRTSTLRFDAQLIGDNLTNSMLLSSNTPDSVTSGTVPAVKVRATQALTGTDKVFAVHRDTDVQLFSVDQNGNTWIGSDGATRTIWSRYFQSPTSPVEVGTWMSVGTEKAPIRLTTQNAFTADDVAHVSVYNGATQTLTVSKDGLLRVNKGNAAKPTCNADNRGRVYYLDGAAGVADTYEICMKNAADAYAWKTIVTP